MTTINRLTVVDQASDGDIYPISQAGSDRPRGIEFSTMKAAINAEVNAAVEEAVAAAERAEEAAASADANVLRADLATEGDPLKGAELVGYESGTVADKLGELDAFSADLQDPSDPAKGAAVPGRGTVAVASIASLLLQPQRSDLRYLVSSYHAGLGLGGGEFYWDSTSTDADDGGTVFEVPGVATGRFKRVDTGQTWAEDFGAFPDATSLDGTSGTDQTDAFSNAITYANGKRRRLNVSASRTGGVIGFLVGDLPELSGGGVELTGAGPSCTYLISKPSLTYALIRIRANGAGIRDIGLVCNDATKNAYEVTGLTSSSEGYQPSIRNVSIIGGLRSMSQDQGLEIRVQDVHAVDSVDSGFYVARPDALLINASTDRAGTDGFRFNGHVVNTFHAHSIKSARNGFRATFATASQLIGDHADTSGYHGYQLDTCSGVRLIAPFSFKSGEANVAAPGTYPDARNYSLTNNSNCVLVAPMSNQDANCQYAFYGALNSDTVIIAPVDTGTKPSLYGEGTQVVLAKGRQERYNSLAIPKIKTGIAIATGGTGTYEVVEPAEFNRAFNVFAYRGEIVVRLDSQNRVMIGEFHIATGANTTLPSAIPIRWSLNGSSPDVSASITISATYSTTGATLTISNSTGAGVAVGVSVQQIVSAKAP